MRVCREGHEEICHEGKDCPFCAYIEEAETMLGEAEQDLMDMQGKMDMKEEKQEDGQRG